MHEFFCESLFRCGFQTGDSFWVHKNSIYVEQLEELAPETV